ncbi:MAG: hypothetical protein EB033_02500 [Proteobacteria bacterium]|nr:hypothetical protein [Pseudomonadota bacterium]NDF07349.1 hypothetical protein [Pseudomonadota bacterium]NDG98096.1 hypothetical protein [Pseudomonadota bacterium]
MNSRTPTTTRQLAPPEPSAQAPARLHNSGGWAPPQTVFNRTGVATTRAITLPALAATSNLTDVPGPPDDPDAAGDLTAWRLGRYLGVILPDIGLPELVAYATSQLPGFNNLPAIAPAAYITRRQPEMSGTDPTDPWFYLAVRSRIRGRAFIKTAIPELSIHDLKTAVVLHLPKDWTP